MKDGIILASEIDTWRSLDEHPKQNGWYDIKIWGVYQKGMAEILALGLWRDGEWIDTSHRTILGWSEPLRMRDAVNNPVGRNDEALLRLAEKLLQDAQTEFSDAFEDLITARSAKNYSARLARYRDANMFMGDLKVEYCTYGLAKQKDIVETLCRKVLLKHKVKPDNIEEVRKEIHKVVRKWKYDHAQITRIQDQKIFKKREYELDVVARNKILAAVSWGKVYHDD